MMVILKYAFSCVPFENEEHEIAWFIRVTIKSCKDLLKSFFHSHVTLNRIMKVPAQMQYGHLEILEAILFLPMKNREFIYLHYYEAYTAPEISRFLEKTKTQFIHF